MNRLHLMVALLLCCAGIARAEQREPDAVVVGAGIAGLSAGLELARGGATVLVLVLERNSQGSGHAILASGFAIAATPLQREQGFADTPEKAYRAWENYTGDGDPAWTRFYAQHSRAMIYDWVQALGVPFTELSRDFANRDIPRFHYTRGQAAPVILRIYQEALRQPNIRFQWNTEVTALLRDKGVVTGVRWRNLRDDSRGSARARAVILATGGFEGDLARVRAHWPAALPVPQTLLSGAGIFATGSGLDLAGSAGAALTRLDRHYIYYIGIPDPEGGPRGLSFTSSQAIWVNGGGRRFVDIYALDKDIFSAVMRQQPAGYWLIFDAAGAAAVHPVAVHYRNDPEKFRREILDNPRIVQRAGSIATLARAAGLPEAALTETVARYNHLVDSGVDSDFGRFPATFSGNAALRAVQPQRIERPPFYAVRIYPYAMKSMGGVKVDRDTRALDDNGRIIPGLYAAGEVNGSVGINGSHGLNGMFLGPALMTGRLAGQASLQALARRGDWQPHNAAALLPMPQAIAAAAELPLDAAALQTLLSRSRPGYWHFEISHRLVLERGLQCNLCHSAAVPQRALSDNRAKLAQTLSCRVCH